MTGRCYDDSSRHLAVTPRMRTSHLLQAHAQAMQACKHHGAPMQAHLWVCHHLQPGDLEQGGGRAGAPQSLAQHVSHDAPYLDDERSFKLGFIAWCLGFGKLQGKALVQHVTHDTAYLYNRHTDVY